MTYLRKLIRRGLGVGSSIMFLPTDVSDNSQLQNVSFEVLLVAIDERNFAFSWNNHNLPADYGFFFSPCMDTTVKCRYNKGRKWVKS